MLHAHPHALSSHTSPVAMAKAHRMATVRCGRLIVASIADRLRTFATKNEIMHTISREQARDLIDHEENLTVVEALPEKYYNKFHLPGAQNVPLDDSFTESIQSIAPDLSAPVLVYCMDTECDAATKAAAIMEELGYTRIYDYEAGKVDWKEAGLPIEEPSDSSA